jgi:hypothetical protein
LQRPGSARAACARSPRASFPPLPHSSLLSAPASLPLGLSASTFNSVTLSVCLSLPLLSLSLSLYWSSVPHPSGRLAHREREALPLSLSLCVCLRPTALGPLPLPSPLLCVYVRPPPLSSKEERVQKSLPRGPRSSRRWLQVLVTRGGRRGTTEASPRVS